MPRPPRLDVAGAYFHVTTRAAAERPVLGNDEGRFSFLEVLLRTVRRQRWVCHAYCLMTNHYHLLLETTEATLSAGMHLLNGCYARTFNRRHGTKGHVFGARFYSALVETDSHLLATVRYVALNPVRAGLVTTPEEWPWSSYAYLVGGRERVPGIVDRRRTLALLDDGRHAQEAVRRFVEEELLTPR